MRLDMLGSLLDAIHARFTLPHRRKNGFGFPFIMVPIYADGSQTVPDLLFANLFICLAQGTRTGPVPHARISGFPKGNDGIRRVRHGGGAKITAQTAPAVFIGPKFSAP